MTRRDKFLLWCLVWSFIDAWVLYSWGWQTGGVLGYVLYSITLVCFLIMVALMAEEVLRWEGKE